MAGLRLGEKALNIYKSIWHQHLGAVKTDESEKIMPLDDEMITDLQLWRIETPYADDFGSPIINNHEGQEADSQTGREYPLPDFWGGAGREMRT